RSFVVCATQDDVGGDMFKDQIVWITGASSGIGEALAIAWSREGARVILSARNVAELERVRQSCEQPERHVVKPLDLTDGDAIRNAAAEVLRDFGHVDILVHSGGVSQRSLAVETDLATDRRIMELNYFGTVALTKALLPSMLARRSGHIVPISSVIGYVGVPLRSAYAASKHALHGFFNALRAETHKHGVRVTIVCPGYIRTNVSQNALRGDGTRHGQLDDTHRNAMLPEEAAPAILRGVAQNKREVHVGGREIHAIRLQRHLPAVVARVLRVK
ncbi:MAG TPA: SDR family oxidoreductase, partial [Vicinamibacterales bacterium]|nr:SDR family oxidoreductase [Vicinamibacterales bacterium]